MKFCCGLLALALVGSALAQNAPSPEVLPDGRVTFRLKAPEARVVRVQCEGLVDANMVKDGQGVWSFTTAPLEPDFYGYTFIIDGVRVMDPNNPSIKYNLLSPESEAHVPGPASLPWEVNDVPHGVVHRHFYHSAAGGDDRAFFVYTPPGYKDSARARYPVLYLLHGFNQEAGAWCSVGRANIILDNLIARGAAKPMVVVMPLGYGTIEVVHRGWTNLSQPDNWERNMNQFRATLLDEVLPQVESAYRVSTNRQERALAGLSMGGAETLTVGLNALDRFAWIGAFGAGGLNTNYSAVFPTLNAAANRRLRLLWIACGKQDAWLDPNRRFVQWLEARGVHCSWTETAGRHSFRSWRPDLAAFVPLLFQHTSRVE